MKLRNRLMSWILSPGTYMVWHALGDPEEWKLDSHTLVHKATGFNLWVANGSWFYGEWDGDKREVFGLFERHLLQFRVRRVVRKLKEPTGWRARNHRLFTRMTQLTGKLNDR